MMVPLLALLVLFIWLTMWLAHGFFWRIDADPVPGPPENWPSVTVIIPARNEETVIEETLRSLLHQDYPAPLQIVVVDDHSTDRTASVAVATSTNAPPQRNIRVLSAEPLPAGWGGKVWAMHQGILRGLDTQLPPRYLLFSDADISHGSGVVRELVCRAERSGFELSSLMVRLSCRSSAEHLMIPAFVFFFKMLYPFRWSNDPRHPLAAAAGGTMLLRLDTLVRLENLACIRQELIDDCALARAVKRGGHPIWIGLSDTSVSTRHYTHLSEILSMISRTAYTQLGYSPLRLLGCVLGLVLTFLAPTLLLLTARGAPAIAGGLIWLLMCLLYWPMVRFYRLSIFWSLTLPITAILYLWATCQSAWQHHRGRGGMWKGRTQSAESVR